METEKRFQWVEVPKQRDETEYITGMDALNIPSDGPGGDWHRSGWECLKERPWRLKLGCEETIGILGTRGVKDARRGLRQLNYRSVLGHPAGWRLQAVYAASYARAIVDMLAMAIARQEPELRPGPRESIAWCGTVRELALCWSLWKEMEERSRSDRRRAWHDWWEEVIWHCDHPRSLQQQR